MFETQLQAWHDSATVICASGPEAAWGSELTFPAERPVPVERVLRSRTVTGVLLDPRL